MILIKAGGSAITDKKVPFSIKRDALQTLAKGLSNATDDIVLCHGGGSFGHPLALEYGISGVICSKLQMEGISKINVAMRELSNVVCETLREGGCLPFAVQTSCVMASSSGRVERFDATPVTDLVERGYIPVLYGDAVIDREYGFSILSGDQIIQVLAREMGASRAIFLTDVDGLYEGDPKKSDNVRLIGETTLDNLGKIDASTTGDVTGGMRGKLDEIRNLKGYVDEVILCNISSENAISEALSGGNPGTRITL